MPNFCAVNGCNNTSARNAKVAYHAFPRNKERFKKWITFCARSEGWIPLKNQGICSAHFDVNNYDENFKIRHELIGAKFRRQLKTNALPNRNRKSDEHPNNIETSLEDYSKDSSLFNVPSFEENINQSPIHDINIINKSEIETIGTQQAELEKKCCVIKKHEAEIALLTLSLQRSEDMCRRLTLEVKNANARILEQEQHIVNLSTANKTIVISHENESKLLGRLTLEVKTANARIVEQEQHIVNITTANKTIVINHEYESKLLRKRLQEIEMKIRKCEAEHMDSFQFVKHVRQALKNVFSPNQVDVILGRKKQPRWTSDEISKAFVIRYLSKRCYLYLRDEIHMPLPGITTLQRYARRIDLRNGILKDVLNFMRVVGQSMTPKDLVCIISYDEMSVRRLLEYDLREDEIIGPHTHAQLVMVRGLFSKWKQVIFVAFDQPMNKSILFEIIEELHNINYNVVGITSDNGSENVLLRKTLGITMENTFFNHPVTQAKIYAFGDCPHNLKLIRNWFVGEGIVWKGRVINTKLIRMLIDQRSNCELTPLFALTNKHLDLSSAEKQNVAKAAKLLSHTTATAVREYFKDTQYAEESDDVARFIQITNDWFDIFNSFSQYANQRLKCSFEAADDQIQVLDSMLKLMYDSRVIGKNGKIHKSLVVFQQSIIMSIISLKDLYSDLQKKYDFKCISTFKLNQDLLENFISQLRAKGGLDDRPAPISLLYRLRLLILGKTPGITQRNTNTRDQDLQSEERDEFITAHFFKQANVVPDITELSGSYTDDTIEADAYTGEGIEESSSLISVSSDIIDNCQEKDGFIYLLGWVAYKLQKTHPDLGDKTAAVERMINNSHLPAFLANLSYGGLTVPSPELQAIGKAMEKIFILHHGVSGFSCKTNVVQTVVKRVLAQYPKFDEKVVQKYIKIRTIARMRYINMQAQGLLTTVDSNTRTDQGQTYNTSALLKRRYPNLTSDHATHETFADNTHVIRKYKKLSSK